MAIQTATNFNINTNLPLDTRSHVKTIAERNAIPVGVRYPYMKTTVETDGETYVLVGGLDNTCWVRESAQSTSMGAYKWNVNSEANPLIDEVFILKENTWESTGKTLKEFENDNYNGTWFYVGNGSTDAGLTRYKMIEDGYTTTGYHIDGADGYLNCRDYVIWNGRWVRFNVYEAKASEVKNADGKYSPKSGVCGLMSSTQAAYLTDLISEYWDKEKLTVYSTPNPPEGWQTNLLFNTGWYLGCIKKDCDGHPPVVNGHHTSWAVLVLNGMATDAESLNHNHRLQLAFDVVNSKIYMRRGWMSENTWADNWDEVGKIADGSIVTAMLANFCVTEERLADNSVTPSKLSDEVTKAIESANTNIGELAELETEAKESVVAALNEVNEKIPIGGSVGQALCYNDDGTAHWDYIAPFVAADATFTSASEDIGHWHCDIDIDGFTVRHGAMLNALITVPEAYESVWDSVDNGISLIVNGISGEVIFNLSEIAKTPKMIRNRCGTFICVQRSQSTFQWLLASGGTNDETNDTNATDATVFKGVIGNSTQFDTILSANEWKAGWTWKASAKGVLSHTYVVDIGDMDDAEVGDTIIAIADHPETPISSSAEYVKYYFAVIRANTDNSDVAALQDRIAALEAQLGGISFSIEDGHLNYEKEETVNENS